METLCLKPRIFAVTCYETTYGMFWYLRQSARQAYSRQKNEIGRYLGAKVKMCTPVHGISGCSAIEQTSVRVLVQYTFSLLPLNLVQFGFCTNLVRFAQISLSRRLSGICSALHTVAYFVIWSAFAIHIHRVFILFYFIFIFHSFILFYFVLFYFISFILGSCGIMI